MSELAKALVEFQKQLPSVRKGQTAKVKTKTGADYTYDYADLTDITEVAIPLLTQHGLAWSSRPTMSEHGFVLRYSLTHISGEGESGDYPLPDPSRSTPQEIGSALTYARRYALTAITGIAPGGDDDDGQKASNAKSRKPTQERLSDAAWMDDFETRLAFATLPSEVRDLDKEAHLKYADGGLTQQDAKRLKAGVDNRLAELTAPVGA